MAAGSGEKIAFIDLAAQQKRIRADLDARMARVLDHGQYIMGPEVPEFEQKLAAFVGSKHCISMANGTDALMIAMMALGIGRGDEVITPAFTFFATAETIAILGATPVFVDIDPSTYNIDVSQVEGKITSRTKAIIPVGLYGQCADMDSLKEIAQRHGLPIVEDAAQSLGATYRGRQSGALGTISCTSFFPSKSLGCYGDGGACFTDDDQLATQLRWIRTHGQDRRYHHAIIGVNSRLDTLQAAILLAKLEVFSDEVASRARIGARYTELLRGIAKTPVIAPGNTSVYAQYTIEVDQRDSVMAKLADRGVPTVVHYPMPLHRQPAFRALGLPEESFPVSDRASERVMSLPMHPYLDSATQDFVVEQVKQVLATF